jgi:hypothetical protein
MTVEIILNRSWAMTIWDLCAGMMIPCPMVNAWDFPAMTISALPSMI